MKIFAAVACVLIASTPAHAISRYTATTMDCAEVQAAIKRDGAAIVYYRSRNADAPPLFDRYVATQQFCQSNEVSRFTSIPAADTNSCRVRGCVDYDIKPETNSR